MLNVERDFKALDLQITEPSHQRERDTAQLKRSDVPVAPHQRLPTELLSCILLLVTKDPPFKVPLAPEFTPSWTLRHVCSRWRNVILDHRNLWSSISVDLAADKGDSYEETVDVKRAARLVDLVLPKVGTISIFICIDGQFMRIKNAIDTIIRPYSSRVIDLSIGLPGHGFDALSQLLLDQLNSLNSLDIEFLRNSNCGQGIRDFPSSLRKLTISADIDSCPSVSSPQIHWNNITDLDFTRIYAKFTHIFPILKHCESMKTCAITVRDCNSGPQGQYINLPCLYDFYVSLDHPAFFDSFTLPSLCRLTVETAFCDFPAAQITSMIGRSGCALKGLNHYHLERQTPPCDSDTLMALVTSTSSLQTLAVRFVVPRLLIRRIGNGGLLPNLEELQCELEAETGDAFLDAVEHRLQSKPDGASNGVLRSALGICRHEPHLADDMQAFVDRAFRLNAAHNSNVRFVPYG